MNHLVGQEYAFVRFDYVRRCETNPHFLAGKDAIERIHIETMECVELRPFVSRVKLFNSNTLSFHVPPQGVFLDRFGELWRESDLTIQPASVEQMSDILPLEGERMRQSLPIQKVASMAYLGGWLSSLRARLYAEVAKALDEYVADWEESSVVSGRLTAIGNAVELALIVSKGAYVEYPDPDQLFTPAKMILGTTLGKGEALIRKQALTNLVNQNPFAQAVMNKIVIV